MGTGVIHIIPEWLEFIFLTCCIGTVVCRLFVLVGAEDAGVPWQAPFVRMWRLFGVSAAALAASSFADLLVRTAEMSEQPVSALFPLLPTVVSRTHLGQVCLLRIVAAFTLLILLRAGKRYRDRSRFLVLLLGILGIIAWTKSASGHAADMGDFSSAEIVDWLHLVAVSVWGGGLLVLSAAVFPYVVEPDEHPALMARIASRFSRVAGYAVGVIAITAILNARSFVGSFDALAGSPYGWTVAAKVVLFLNLIILGAYNRYVAIPFLQKEANPDLAPHWIERFIAFPKSYPIAQEFIFRVKIEAIILVIVLFCGALLRHEIPARHALHPRHGGMDGGHGGRHQP